MLLKRCLRDGCAYLSDRAYCPQHRAKDTRTRRDRPADASQDWRWRKLAQAAKAKQPWCSRCGATTDLTGEHTIPVSIDPTLAYEPLNIDVLCRSCNSAKGDTVDEMQRMAVYRAIDERNRRPQAM